MGRPNCQGKSELKKGPWTREEDQILLGYIQEHGHGSWRSLPAKAGLQRCGKSCRLRWTNYLRPDIKRGKFSPHEEKAIIRLHALLGNRWSAIAAHLPKRTDNEIKNYWNTRLKKRLARMGIDPSTHKPKNNPSGSAQSRHAANLSHMAQWETARLEAEARLARESKLLSNLRLLHNKFNPRRPSVLPRPFPRHTTASPPYLDVLKVWQASSSAPGCFFGSAAAGSLESPTSTLSFSCGTNCTVPAVIGNDVVSTNNGSSRTCDTVMVGSGEGMEQVREDDPYGDLACHVDGIYGYEEAGAMDVAAVDYGCVNAVMEEFEESRNYWNELLHMVSSPLMELPRF